MFLNLEFNNNEKIIDTHCHLDSESFYDDLDEMLFHAFNNGIEKIIIPGADIKDLARARELAMKYKQIYYAAGVHPYEVDGFDEEILREHLSNEKCVAVGECGLDYYRLKAGDELEKNLQKKIFKAQLELACEFEKPVIIHCREANEDIYGMLIAYVSRLKGGVLHCFNASKHLLQLANNGFYFGIGGVLTFKNAKNLLEILPLIPRDKLLIETDAPYLSPEPFRGKRNEPILTHFVAQKMSEILKLSKEEVLKLCFANSNNLFFKGYV
ncbi:MULTISPECIES: TatD family hydrolase [unclassified Campylobacter]|uniref:TatD family hydrolase n=1 Tax=unclassified Campylobacter TaxID=2593542 RepID=UPI001237B544|nr:MULTISPECIES: TatD family hydrolase [unclassified Campylobacter]KAA6226425.1 TatD family deoxyribonuclease [Campylobacter sp. LR286c]KAA6226537.1 TatD family deoxyribonuclease [Campylobacter sp. LR185c]KAA6226913.1 TatD family deoxyribonuclease [Campylobacter sp. LR196d]KAA6233657.1 TatD family deoxyribonuclease [Campylobacter sp. LR291e]KAA6233877.1 TatD family deoxyribonuclease [Campylobacter sp. LR264d]